MLRVGTGVEVFPTNICARLEQYHGYNGTPVQSCVAFITQPVSHSVLSVWIRPAHHTSPHERFILLSQSILVGVEVCNIIPHSRVMTIK